MNNSDKVRRAKRIFRVVTYMYATGRVEWAFPWAREWHRLAADLKQQGINIYPA